uniref:28S ribosomal protein S24, mitochondrial n=1 Tax=Balaenoptera musculus TaxID=9771 RepID=A0A8C0HXN0_BALMU
ERNIHCSGIKHFPKLNLICINLNTSPPSPTSREVGAKNRAARVGLGKGDKLVTCEEAHAPHHITHRKDWLSLHTGNLDGEDQATERAVEDVFLHQFLLGIFPGSPDQLILKRQANQVEICALVLRQLPAHRFSFLVGYGDTLLSHFYKCPVHLQTVPSKIVCI